MKVASPRSFSPLLPERDRRSPTKGPMSLQRLSTEDRDVVRQCLVALRDGCYLDTEDTQTRIGVEPMVFDSMLAAWPDLDDTDDRSEACTVVNNALNEVCHGIRISDGEWRVWFSVGRDDVLAVYYRWARLRGWNDTGVR